MVRSDLRLHPREMPTRLEAGTPNVPALEGLAAALRRQEKHGGGFRSAAGAFTCRVILSRTNREAIHDQFEEVITNRDK